MNETTKFAPPKNSMICTKDMHKFFGEKHILKDINLNIFKGEVIVVLGPSGCGKSTLLRCFNELETISAGRLWINGELLGVREIEKDGKIITHRHGISKIQPISSHDST